MDLLTILGNGGEVGAIKTAMVAAFKVAMPRGIEVYHGVPDSMHYPCICTGQVQITPSQTMGNSVSPGMEEMTFTVPVFTSAAEDDSGQRLLDAMLSRNGLIRKAIWGMRGAPGQPALGGACDDLFLFDISGYGMISMGDNGSAYGANLFIRAIVS